MKSKRRSKKDRSMEPPDSCRNIPLFKTEKQTVTLLQDTFRSGGRIGRKDQIFQVIGKPVYDKVIDEIWVKHHSLGRVKLFSYEYKMNENI